MLFTFFVILLGLISISLHELGHAWAMRDCGISVERVSLLGIPGLGTFKIPMHLSRFPTTEWVVHPFIIGAYVKPNSEEMKKASANDRIYIAGCGPLVNISFAFVLMGLAILSGVLSKALGDAIPITLIKLVVFVSPLFLAGWLTWRYRRFLTRYAIPVLVAIALAMFLGNLWSAGISPSGSSDFVRNLHGQGQTIHVKEPGYGLYFALGMGAALSFLLGVLNLLPLLPLDGGRIAQEYLPERWKDTYAFLTVPIVLTLIALSLGKDVWNFAHLFF